MGVTVIVPVGESGQVVAVELIVAVNGVLPAATVIFIVPVHPTLSVKVITCGPAATLVNTLLACGAPPSSLYVYGAVPLVGVTVMVPSGESGQLVAVDVAVPVIVVLVFIIAVNVVSQPTASTTLTV